MPPDSLQLADCGCSFLFIVIMVIVVSQILASAKRQQSMTGMGSGIPTQDTFRASIDAIREAIQTQGGAPGSFGTAMPSDPLQGIIPPRPVPSRPPIDWNMIKLNLSKEQIKECFDMEALAKGVKKEDLHNYVFIDRLRNHFSEPQLQDMIDMEFFTRADRAKAAAVTALGASSLPGLGKKTTGSRLTDKPMAIQGKVAEIASIKSAGQDRIAEISSIKRIGEEFAEERVVEEFPGAEQSDDARARAIAEEERIVDEIQTMVHNDPIFSEIMMKLSPEKRKMLAYSLKDIADRASKTAPPRSDVLNGIIWSEILKRRHTGGGPRRGRAGGGII